MTSIQMNRSGIVENNLAQQLEQLKTREGGKESAKWYGLQYAPSASLGINLLPNVYKFGLNHQNYLVIYFLPFIPSTLFISCHHSSLVFSS